MPFYPYFDTPALYLNKFDFYNVGSSPLLLSKLIGYLDDNNGNIEEIFLSFYIFNNPVLHDKLRSLALGGVKVNIITIPLEGYDANSPQAIINISTYQQESVATKYDLARMIFAEHYKTPIPGFSIFLFPHMFIRSPYVIKFARGNMPYSLHTKSFLIKLKNGKGTVGISSSNFAVRDLVKEENLLMIENEDNYHNRAEHFFKDLISVSIPFKHFDHQADYTTYQVPLLSAINDSRCGFISRFYFDSGFIAEDKLIELLATAKKEILVLGQHVCPIGYTFNREYHSKCSNVEISRTGLLPTIISRAKDGATVIFGSQTFAYDSSSPDTKFREPANKSAFLKFLNLIKDQPNIAYFVNENIHSKYIVIDGLVIVTSFNYTPTQFIFLDKVNMPTLQNNPSLSYSGTYSECGHYMIIDDHKTVAGYKQNFNDIRCRAGSISIQ